MNGYEKNFQKTTTPKKFLKMSVVNLCKNVWEEQTVSHFRNIVKRRQKQSSLDKFLIKVRR